MSENNLYLLPDENALAMEIVFAINKYDLLNWNTDKELIEKLKGAKSWIIDPKIVPLLDLRLREGVESSYYIDQKTSTYLRGLCERVKLQREIVMNPEFKFDFKNMRPETLAQIKSASFPSISKYFNYRFINPIDKYQSFKALEHLSDLRPYLNDIQPYLNRMSNHYVPMKNNYHPKQIEFALPILYQIQQAKEQNISESSIQEAIKILNNNYITSPEHFHVVLETMKERELSNKGYFEDFPNKTQIPSAVQDVIKDTELEIRASQQGLPLTYSQVAVMTTAKTPELAREIGLLMSKSYVSTDLAASIVDNVNAIVNARNGIDIKHLTQTLALVGETSRMTPTEMTVLGNIILNQNLDLKFHEVRSAVKDVKEMKIGDVWSPPKMKAEGYKKELAEIER